ncbi:hypothetical protein FOCC_FOCC005079 [Frankliniella occidentalis]|nr:hypothetical protein FOCC_FOCC005079 [Frankliniella occidentalis]
MVGEPVARRGRGVARGRVHALPVRPGRLGLQHVHARRVLRLHDPARLLLPSVLRWRWRRDPARHAARRHGAARARRARRRLLRLAPPPPAPDPGDRPRRRPEAAQQGAGALHDVQDDSHGPEMMGRVKMVTPAPVSSARSALRTFIPKRGPENVSRIRCWIVSVLQAGQGRGAAVSPLGCV